MAKPILGPLEFRDKEGDLVDLNDHPLLHKTLMHVGHLWLKHEKKFMNAMDDSQRKQIQVNFATILNTKEAAPVVDTTISFKDKAKESGMDVIKTYRDSETDEIPDPNAPMLPGTEGTKGEGHLAEGDKPAASEGEAASDGAANGEQTAPRKRGRPKKKA